MNIREWIGWGVHVTGLAGLFRKILLRDGRLALNFHGVSRQRYANIPRDFQPHHSITEFRQVLEWLLPRFSFLSVEEFFSGEKPGILMTFDDGSANNLTNILPVLAEFQAQGLFFISAQHVEDPKDWLPYVRRDARHLWKSEADVPEDFSRDCYDGLSRDQLKKLAGSPWAIIGSHAVTHPSLPQCPPGQLHSELVKSRQYLQEISGQPVDYFAYPFGDYDRNTALAVRDAGYRAAFAVDSHHVGLPGYEIPRVGIYDHQASYLDLKLSGLHRPALRGPILTQSIRQHEP